MPGWLKTLLLLCSWLPGLAQAQEVIEDFTVQLRVGSDAMLDVHERITVRAEGEQIKRGIYRDLPVVYRLPGGLLRKTPVASLTATRDGEPESVRSEQVGAYQRFYLGSANHYLAPGRYIYDLHYRVDPQLLQRDGEDELYWNVTGNNWAFPILQAAVQVQLPVGAQIGKVAAYTGASGAQGQDYQVLEQGSDNLTLRTTQPLQPEEGLTLAVDWQAGLVARRSALQQSWQVLFDNAGLVLGGLFWLALLGYYMKTWRRIGRDPRQGVHFVRFEAPQGLSPTQVGYLWHRGFRGTFDEARALSVCFTDWAIHRLIQLQERPRADGFVLQRGTAELEVARPLEQPWLSLLFPQGKGDKPLELGRKYQSRLAEMKSLMAGQLQTEGRQWYANNRGAWATGLALALPGLLLSVLTGAQGEEQLTLGIAGLVFSLGFGIPCVVVLVMARREAIWGKRIGLGLVALLFGWPVPVGLGMLYYATSWPVLLLVGLYVLTAGGVYRWLEAPSVLGQQLLDALAGYRDYLQLAESDSLARAAEMPTMSIELYEQHLPYAMALSVEEQWSARFAAALEAGLIDPTQHEYQPDWYQARNRFSSPSAFAGSLASSLVSASASASTPPASSSSSGGGSSGGGSSGGGSGGGGGGGW